MDKIRSLKGKYNMPSEEELNHAFRMHVPRMGEALKEKEQHFQGLSAKLHELQSKVASTEESLNSEKHILSEKIQNQLTCCAQLQELEVDRNNILLEIHQLETKRNHLRNKKPSMKDQQTVENGRKKLEYYKLLTGIRWDFGAPKGTTKGYVTNRKDHIHTFNYQDKDCGSQLKDLLWREIAQGVARSSPKDSDCKENRVPNK